MSDLITSVKHRNMLAIFNHTVLLLSNNGTLILNKHQQFMILDSDVPLFKCLVTVSAHLPFLNLTATRDALFAIV
jgi:hypothetical protein